jgi:hypothetical protein
VSERIELTPKEAHEAIETTLNCCLPRAKWDEVLAEANIAEVLGAAFDGGNGMGKLGWGSTDTSRVILLRLTDGRYAVWTDSEDYTGHG